MSKNTMTQSVDLKLIFPRLLWLVFVLLLGSLRVVYWLTAMTLYLVSFLPIWLLVVMLPKGPVLELMQAELEESIQRFVVVRYNILVSFLSLKNLKQRLGVAHKTELEEDQQQSTSQSGTKK